MERRTNDGAFEWSFRPRHSNADLLENKCTARIAPIANTKGHVTSLRPCPLQAFYIPSSRGRLEDAH
eukprot:scaffold346_cov347-Pavlova_lutheri.AAC.6